MRNYLFIFTVFLSLSMSAQEVQLTWQKDFNIATELSKAQNKLMLIYFTKNDCADCQKFYSDFFIQEAFKKLSDNFVLLMLDGSNTDVTTTDISIIKQRRLIMHYNKSSAFPSVLIIDVDGQEIGDALVSTTEDSIHTFWTFLESLKIN